MRAAAPSPEEESPDLWLPWLEVAVFAALSAAARSAICCIWSGGNLRIRLRAALGAAAPPPEKEAPPLPAPFSPWLEVASLRGAEEALGLFSPWLEVALRVADKEDPSLPGLFSP